MSHVGLNSKVTHVRDMVPSSSSCGRTSTFHPVLSNSSQPTVFNQIKAFNTLERRQGHGAQTLALSDDAREPSGGEFVLLEPSSKLQ